MSTHDTAYDTLLAGGRVVCPAGKIDAVMDVAIRNGKIAAVGPNLAGTARERVDCSGLIVTPGLIDAHAHIYTSSHAAMPTDEAGVFAGAATVVDGGSSGYMTFPDFLRRDLKGACTDAYAYLNHNPIGQAVMPEIWAPSRIRVHRSRIVETIREYRDRIIGLKDRAVGSFIGFQGVKGAEEGRGICDECGIPYVVHIGVDATDELPDRELDAFTRELIKMMQPGDMISHVCTGKRGRIFRADGAFDRELRDARERGVVFDCCCGASNFSIEAFNLGRERGFLPDIISTDITRMSAKGPAKNLGVVISKFLALDVPLAAAIQWVTTNAARAIGMADCKGALVVGRRADITVSELREGKFQFLDHFGGIVFPGTQLFVPRLVFAAGTQHRVRNAGAPTLPE